MSFFRPFLRSLAGGEYAPVASVFYAAFAGDSITETAHEWRTETYVGTSINAVYHTARYELDNIVDINVAHVNGGLNQSLSVTVDGDSVTINLATDGAGVITSTVAQVVAFCNNDTGYKAAGLYARTLGSTHLAQAGTAKYLTPQTATTADGYAAWMQLLSGGKFEFVRFNPTTYPALLAGSYNFGKSGLTTAGIKTYILPDLLILAAGKLVFEMSGTNDILAGNIDAAVTVANRVDMWEQLILAGCTVVACEVPPTPNAARQVTTAALNALLKAEADTLNIKWIEWPAAMYDGTEGDATLFEVDEIHPNPAGCFVMAEHALTEVADLLTGAEFEFPSEGAARWLTANPYMTGGGTVAGGWSTPTAFADATVTPSKVSVAGRLWQRLTVTQAEGQCKLAAFNLANQPMVAGTRVRVVGKIKVSAGFKNVRIKLVFNTPESTLAALEAIDDGQNMTSLDYTVTLPEHEGVWLSPPELVPTGATSATLTVWTFGEGTVDIGICGVISEP